jgi:GTPase SAR1 family protein
MIQKEKSIGLYDILTYPSYALKCYASTIGLKNKVEELRKSGYCIIGYGAAAKGNTLLNFGKIKLDFIIDDNPLKQNLLTPGTNIPIFSSDSLIKFGTDDKIAFIPLAWNFYTEIKEKIKKKRNNNNDLFIRYFPNLNIED